MVFGLYTSSSTTSSFIIFKSIFENCLLNDSNYPLCYYYSTSLNNPGSTYNATNTNSDTWHELLDSEIHPLGDGIVLEHTIYGLKPNTTYYIWTAAAAESGHSEHSPISIEINGVSKIYTCSDHDSIVTRELRPSVTQYSKITKKQMDELKRYIDNAPSLNSPPIEVIQYDTITATSSKSYNWMAYTGNSIDADWYNDT